MSSLAAPQSGRSMRATSTFREGADGNYDPSAPPKSDLEEKSNRDNFRVQPGQTHVLMDVEGPGVITHMWITFLGPEPHPWANDGSANHQEMLLRIYWDGSDRPGVEAPFGDFFAGCFGKRSEVISLPVIVEGGDSYNCFWHMPFRKSARVEIVNESEKPISLLYYNIDWIKKDEIPEETPYFYAQYRQEYPTSGGKPYLLLETEGKGHYVGTVFSVRTRSPSWFGEGDEMVSIDGEAIPSVWGTGTEDYFLCAWGLERTITPYFGVPYFDQWGIVGGHTSAYRWHVNDPFVFQKSIKVEFETFGWMSPDENPEYRAMSWNPREDDYSSVAFWYQTGTPTFSARAPHAKERKLPSLELATYSAVGFTGDVFEAEGPQRLETPEGVERRFQEVRDSGGIVSSGVELGLQLLEGVHVGPQLLVMPFISAKGHVEFPIVVTGEGPMRLLLNATVGPDYGIWRSTLDGVPLAKPFDLYAEKYEQREIHLLDFWAKPGTYHLRLESQGKRYAASASRLGLESILLRGRRPRVAEMAHDREKDWRKEPKLYE